MVTENKYPNLSRELFGLSADTKPTTDFNGVPISNGSAFLEIDTGDVYLFDKDAGDWTKL